MYAVKAETTPTYCFSTFKYHFNLNGWSQLCQGRCHAGWLKCIIEQPFQDHLKYPELRNTQSLLCNSELRSLQSLLCISAIHFLNIYNVFRNNFLKLTLQGLKKTFKFVNMLRLSSFHHCATMSWDLQHGRFFGAVFGPTLYVQLQLGYLFNKNKRKIIGQQSTAAQIKPYQ